MVRFFRVVETYGAKCRWLSAVLCLSPSIIRATRKTTVVCTALFAADSRRGALLGLASVTAGLLASGNQPACAAIGVWDGEKGLNMCDLGDEGADCRMRLIQ
jgi:hypothetical protein